MRILLTGAAGFLGSHLADMLLDKGHVVIGLDDLSTGSLDNLESALHNENFEFIEHDVRNPIDVTCDFILNFACPASPVQYQIDPVRTIETNFLGVINLLHLAKKNGAKLLQASTSEIYGDPTISPQTEEYWGNVNPIGIRSCYDEGKRAAETLCFDYKRQFSIDTRVIRIFNTYGPRMAKNDGRVISNFIVQALTGQDITIYGDGRQTRSFCYVSDLVTAIYSVILLDSLEGPINLGNPTDINMQDIAKFIIAKTQSSSKLTFKDLPLDDPKLRKPDITKAQKLLAWEPVVQLEEGIERTTSYFSKILGL
jgi:UDP-glucuronate decarboxylase